MGLELKQFMLIAVAGLSIVAVNAFGQDTKQSSRAATDTKLLTVNELVTLFHHSRQRIMGLKLSNPESAYDRATSSCCDREIRG